MRLNDYGLMFHSRGRTSLYKNIAGISAVELLTDGCEIIYNGSLIIFSIENYSHTGSVRFYGINGCFSRDIKILTPGYTYHQFLIAATNTQDYKYDKDVVFIRTRLETALL